MDEHDVDWQKTLTHLVELAAENPEKFTAEVTSVAKRFGHTVEQVYAKIQEDPELSKKLAGKSFRNSIIQGVAKRLKRELGL